MTLSGSSASSEAIMYSVADNSGNTLFEYKDFSTDHVGVPQCRGWEYVYAHREGDTVNMTMFYMGNMDKFEWPYESQITTWSYAFDELTGELVYNQDKQTADSFMRATGEWGDYTSQNGLLCFSPSVTTKESLGLIEDNALLLYDFNAKEGDKYESFRMEQTLDGQSSDPSFDMVTVLETGYTEIDHQNCRVHKITCGGREYSIIEGIGSEETGLMPYSNIFDSGKGICSGFRLNRVFNIFLNRNEENVIFYSPNYIDVSNLGNTDGVESMFAEELGLLRYDKGNIYADGLRIIIYDVNGMIAAEGFGEVSTENLQPGVYVAGSGTQTLKILVR